MRIKLHAYFAGNLGDDLMVRLLLERYPDIRFFAETWAEETDAFREYPNFEDLNRLAARHGRLNHLVNILTGYRFPHAYRDRVITRRNRTCAAGVYIGGSVYTERTTPEGEDEKLGTGPLFVIGANYARQAGDFENYFARCGGVTFREAASFRRFFHLGNVRLAPDVVLNLQPRARACGGHVLISVMELGREYEDFLVKLCHACDRPLLVSFCRKEGDEAAAERVAARAKNARVLRYRGDPEPILAAFAGAERVIATRFHAMILAFCHRRPVFALAYSEKTENVAADMDFTAIARISDINDLDAGQVLARCALPPDLENHCREAKNQFSQLDEFLEGYGGNRQHHRARLPGEGLDRRMCGKHTGSVLPGFPAVSHRRRQR